ncbi:hypothetical protein [Streptosporangium longisporum]|uniref:Uncharacterized protein n=1 Tax=Streptosporangium longisporum TaxID=46187 RepID=A0ABP6LAJ9_9ACTN
MSAPQFDTLPTSPDQARTFLTAAEERDCWPTAYSGSLSYSGAVHALRDAQLGTGHATLAVSQELAKLREGLADVGDVAPLRQDLAAIAQAVRELTDALTPAAPLADSTDLSNAVADVRTEVAEVAEVAAAVRELADAILLQTLQAQRQPPRRRWFAPWTEVA